MGKTETVEYTPEVFSEEYGFEPYKIVDLKALMGDASDNIPGVKGIGEKTAMELIKTYGTVENIYADIASLDVKDTLKAKLTEGSQDTKMSYMLATIEKNVPIELTLESCVFSGSFNGGYTIFKRLGFNSLIEKWGITPEIGTVAPNTSLTLPVIDITNVDELKALSLRIESKPCVAVMQLDEGLDGLELCDGDGVYILRWANLGEDYNAFIKTLFSQHIHKLSHNVKDFMGLIMSENLDTDGFIFDTALAAYLLDPTESGYELTRISSKYLEEEKTGTEAVFALYPILTERLKSEGMWELLENIEMPLCDVLADMEHTGFAVDKTALNDFSRVLSIRIDELQKDICLLAGEDFNINSPKQLGVILFEKLMLPSGKKTKTGWSTNVDVLEKLRGKHEIIDKILEYRQLTKLKSTYADGLSSPFERIDVRLTEVVKIVCGYRNRKIRSPIVAEI